MSTSPFPELGEHAGTTFSSQLAARWAFVFDELDVAWEYQPGIVEVMKRLTPFNSRGERPTGYLPDFWFPDHEMWADVRGEMTSQDAVGLLNAAASLSSNMGDGCRDSGGNDVIVLGPIPQPHMFVPLPIRLHMHKGALLASAWDFSSRNGQVHDGVDVAADTGDYNVPPSFFTSGLQGNQPPPDKVSSAYQQAHATLVDPPRRSQAGS